MIEVQGLTKLYGTLVAVDGLSFEVAAGEILGLVGPNGAGKTTTLRAIAGILRPASGRVRIAGCDLAEDPVEAKRRLGFVPDEPRLFEYLTTWEHVEFTARAYRDPEARRRGEELLAELDLEGKRNALPGTLSR